MVQDSWRTAVVPDITQVNIRLLHIKQLFVEFDEVQTQIEELDTTTNQEMEREYVI